MTDTLSPEAAFLRHTLATLAYRAAKPLRDAPAEFADYRVAPGTRSPAEIVAHLGDLMEWGCWMARGEYRWSGSKAGEWNSDVERFFTELRNFDAALGENDGARPVVTQLFQGAVADALTHVGQLNMLRRLAGAPIRGENYAKADIVAGKHLGMEQPAPRMEFD